MRRSASMRSSNRPESAALRGSSGFGARGASGPLTAGPTSLPHIPTVSRGVPPMPARRNAHAPGCPAGTAAASVRLAPESDLPAVGFVQAAVWREAYAGVVDPEVLAAFQPQEFARTWRASLADPPPGVYRLLVALADDRVVGFGATAPTRAPDASMQTGEVLPLGVLLEARRQGHGSRLLNACVH